MSQQQINQLQGELWNAENELPAQIGQWVLDPAAQAMKEAKRSGDMEAFREAKKKYDQGLQQLKEAKADAQRIKAQLARLESGQ